MPAAQIKLVGILQEFCDKHSINIVFTTHSLAIMKKIQESDKGKLFYMDNDNKGEIQIQTRSYNYIASVLYQMQDWDKYILTEDCVLERFIKWSLKDSDTNIKYKIIYIGGASNTVNLMKRNKNEHFFASPDNVITVLDGDQKNHKNKQNVILLPFPSIEKQCFKHYKSGKLDELCCIKAGINKNKILYKEMLKCLKKPPEKVFDWLNIKHGNKIECFKNELLVFLDNT